MKVKALFVPGLIALVILLSSLGNKERNDKINLTKEDECTAWNKSGSHFIQFRWCKDPQLFNATTYQFFNGYGYKVWFYCRLSFTNGESHELNIILDSGEQSDKGSMYKRIPNNWNIYKKQKQDDTGRWVDF